MLGNSLIFRQELDEKIDITLIYKVNMMLQTADSLAQRVKKGKPLA